MMLYFLISVLCFIKINEAAEENIVIPRIIEQIEPAVVEDKGTVYLNCTMVLPKDMWSRASWYSMDDKHSKVISNGLNVVLNVEDINKNSKFEVRFLNHRPIHIPELTGYLEHVHTYQLIIRKYIENYARKFRCEIEQAGEKNFQKSYATGTVILRKTPVINPLSPQIVNEGEPLDITCEAGGSPKPNISWVKANGEPFPLPGAPQRIQNPRLYIPKVGRYDRGMYRCHAQNNVGNAAEYDIMIEVQYKPTVRQARKEGVYAQMPNEDFNMMIECIINGYPDPDLYWYRGVYDPNKSNQLIENGPRHLAQKMKSYGSVGMNITDVFFVLHILNLVDNDMGDYTCMAQNNEGWDMKVINVFKQNVCQGPLCYMTGKSVPKSGSFVHLNRLTLLLILLTTYYRYFIY